MAKVAGTISYTQPSGSVAYTQPSGSVAYTQPSGSVALNYIERYCAEYLAVYNSLTTKPSAAIAEAQNTMVAALVAAGVWAKMDVFYLFAQTVNTAGEALKNWKNPGTYDATAYNSPAFESLAGFTGDGISPYIDTNWNPSANGVNFLQNSASMGVYCRTNSAVDYDIGVTDGTNYAIMGLNVAGWTYLYMNTAALNDRGASANSIGFYVALRNASNSQQVYKNSALVVNGADASNGVPNENMYTMAYNFNGSPTQFTLKQLSLMFAGGALTPTEITNFTNAVETYMDSNSKGVIA